MDGLERMDQPPRRWPVALMVGLFVVSVAGTVVAETEAAAEKGAKFLAIGRKDKAREQYLAALEAKPDEALRTRIEETLGALNVELIRTPWPMAEKKR